MNNYVKYKKYKKKYIDLKKNKGGTMINDVLNIEDMREKIIGFLDKPNIVSMKTVNKEKDDRKRNYNSLKHTDYEVTAEDIEVYKLKKQHFEDPMANFK